MRTFRMIGRCTERGFTLVELLVAVTIFSIALTGMYGIYISTQRTTYSQEEVIDIQQNLRIATDMLGRDIHMAGFMIPAGQLAVTAGSDASVLNLATGSIFYHMAQITADLEIPAGAVAAGTFDFSVVVPEMADLFDAGDVVRVFRPQDGSQPFDPAAGADLVVNGTDRTVPEITLRNFTNAVAVQFKAGDLIALVGAAAADPATISWALNGTDLERNSNDGGGQTVANNVAALQFTYLLEDGTEVDDPDDPLNPPSRLDEIVAVRVVLTGQTTGQTTGQLDGQVRQRQMDGLFRLKNL